MCIPFRTKLFHTIKQYYPSHQQLDVNIMQQSCNRLCFLFLPFYGKVRGAAFPLGVLRRLGRATPGAAHDQTGHMYVCDQARGAGQPSYTQQLGASGKAGAPGYKGGADRGGQGGEGVVGEGWGVGQGFAGRQTNAELVSDMPTMVGPLITK